MKHNITKYNSCWCHVTVYIDDKQRSLLYLKCISGIFAYTCRSNDGKCSVGRLSSARRLTTVIFRVIYACYTVLTRNYKIISSYSCRVNRMAYIKTSKDIKTCFTNPFPFYLVICRNLSCLHLLYSLFQEMVFVFILETLVSLLFSLTCKIYIFKSRDFNANSLDLYTHKFGSKYWVKFSPSLDENVKCGCIQIHVFIPRYFSSWTSKL